MIFIEIFWWKVIFVQCKSRNLSNSCNTTESNKRKDTFETGFADYEFNNQKQTETSSKFI